MNSGENWSEKKTFKNYSDTILYMYTAPRQGQITPRRQHFNGYCVEDSRPSQPFRAMLNCSVYLTKLFLARLGLVVGFNDTSTLVGHFVSSPKEREKRIRRDSSRDEEEGQEKKRKMNESEETEEIKTPPLPLPTVSLAQL